MTMTQMMTEAEEQAYNRRKKADDQKQLAHMSVGIAMGCFTSRVGVGVEGRRVKLGTKIRMRQQWLISTAISVMLMVATAVRARQRRVEVERWVECPTSYDVVYHLIG